MFLKKHSILYLGEEMKKNKFRINKKSLDKSFWYVAQVVIFIIFLRYIYIQDYGKISFLSLFLVALASVVGLGYFYFNLAKENSTIEYITTKRKLYYQCFYYLFWLFLLVIFVVYITR